MKGANSNIPSSDGLNAVHRFLTRLIEDQDAGSVRELDEYVAMFPGYEELIREEYERARSRCHDESVAGLPADARIGPYRCSRRIGGGGQGTVYAAVDTRNGQAVAIKILSPYSALERLSRLRLRREARGL